MTRPVLLIFICLFTFTACSMSDPLPRNMSLKTFDPHRPDFVCKYEADAVPPIDPEAEAWFQEGLRLTSYDLWPNQRNYPEAVKWWEKAAERHHWKAMMNLAGVLIGGKGKESYVVPPDTERAVQIIEEAMRLGIPAAFDTMGTYHWKAMGVKGDASRAYAFWELAANMGSPSAQAFLGSALLAGYDNPKEGFWSNQPVGFKMLECALAQGSGKAAEKLGRHYEVIHKDYAKAIPILHEGVKFGSEDCANSLSSLFRGIEMAKRGGPPPDHARSERYGALGDALYYNPDLRFPNLDKVLPLPPARLPKWDMNQPDTLIDAAKQIIPMPAVKPTPGADRTGRAHIPQGHALPEEPVPLAAERPVGWAWHWKVPPQPEKGSAPYSGYWIARLNHNHRDYQIEWTRRQTPLRFARGEAFVPLDRRSLGEYSKVLGAQWHYLGLPVKLADPAPPVKVARGIARLSRIPQPLLACPGDRACPHTGIWEPRVKDDHPLARVFHAFNRQAYVEQGQDFPDPRDRHLAIDPAAVQWLWADNANQPTSPYTPFIKQITLTDLHDDKAGPLA